MLSQLVSFSCGWFLSENYGKKKNDIVDNTQDDGTPTDSVQSNTGGVEGQITELQSHEELDRLIRMNDFKSPWNNRVVYGGHFPVLINFFSINNCIIKIDTDLTCLIVSRDEYSITLLGGTTISCTLPDRLSLDRLITGQECEFRSTSIQESPIWPDSIEGSMGTGTYQGNLVVTGPFTTAFLCMLKFKGQRTGISYPISQGVVYVQNGTISGNWSKYMKAPSSDFQYIMDDRSGYE